MKDPINSKNIKDFIKECLSICQQVHGAENFQKLVSSLDQTIVTQLKHALP